jgi:PAS domain S-box-containing protein
LRAKFWRYLNTLSLSARISLIALLFLTATTFLISYLFSQYERQNYLDTQDVRQKTILQNNAARLKRNIETLRRDVLFLSGTPPIQGFIRAREGNGYDKAEHSSLADWRARLQEIFLSFANARPEYFQIRYIGVAGNGKELVRIEMNKGVASVTPENRLQSKGGRDYYREILALKQGEVYVSELNLNREWGKVEVPHIRTLRSATPVYTPTGKMFGMVVINMNVGRMLDEVKSTTLMGVQTYLMNDKGDYLVNPDPSRSFGFDLGHSYRWRDDLPGLPLAADGDRQKMHGLHATEVHGRVMYVSFAQIHFDPRLPKRFLTLAFVLSESAIDKEIAGVRDFTVSTIIGLAMLLAGILILIFSRTFRPLGEMTRIAHAIGSGQYDVILPNIKYGEIGTLVRAFREMLNGIKTREEQNKQLTTKVLASEKQANQIIDTAPEAIIVADMQGRIARVNARATQLFGYTREELTGRPVEMLLPERYRSEHVQHREQYTENPSQRMMGLGRELFALHKDGCEVPVEVGLNGMRIKNETYVIAVLADITRRKQAEEALLSMNSELEQRVEERTRQLAASNRELEQFAYVASHDLQEPLRMVASYLQLVERRYKSKLDKTAGEFIDFAVDGANRMKQLIEGLLEYSRVQTRAKEFEAVDMEVILNSVLSDLQFRITERNAAITHDSLPCVMAEPSQMQRLLLNLIGNALKYCENPVPSIHLAAQKLKDATQGLATDLPASGWLFSVSDNGIGIEPEYAERVFQLFQRLHTREAYPGTGLGLALCKRIVERHGGRIWVEPHPGGGSVFYFILAEITADIDSMKVSTDVTDSRIELIAK